MNDLISQLNELIFKAEALKERVEEAYRTKNIRIEEHGIPKLLEIILDDLRKDFLNKQRLESHAFGIFRIVTDGWVFEDTVLGTDLMQFRLEVRGFALRLPDPD